MKYIVGAYAASPSAQPWNPASEAEFLARVAALPELRGLEVPFTGSLHRDEDWLFDHLDPAWDLVLTAIPGTVARVAADPEFGLASPRDAGRRAAVEFTATLRDAVHRAGDRLGRAAVLAVELHSAPTARASAAAFAASMDEIAGWDWAGAALTVEHCDAYRPDVPPQKGYLSLADELAVVAGNPAIAGVTVNWGRSAIEGRSAGTARQHIAETAAAGALAGLMFSGAAATDGPFGPAWLDAHLPPSAEDAPSARTGSFEPTSLLGPREIGQALAAAGGAAAFTGVKIGVRPLDLPVPQRVAYLADALRMVDRIASALSEPSTTRA